MNDWTVEVANEINYLTVLFENSGGLSKQKQEH
jgi:hypothetical protein